MKKSTSIIWGIVLVLAGLVYGLNSLEIFPDINLFFNGWWTLIIIIPCAIGIFTGRDKIGNIIGVLIGVLILLACLDLIDLATLSKLTVPLLIVGAGLVLIFKDLINKKARDAVKRLNAENAPKEPSANSFFSSQKTAFTNRSFRGIDSNAVFGTLEIDLSEAVINGEVVINATSIFGGTTVSVPDNVIVKKTGFSLFGGISDRRKTKCKDSSATLYINVFCLFGGVDIK